MNRIIDKGMILEIDHLSYQTLIDVLDILEARAYSGLVSSHGWIENNPEIRARIFALGGLMSPFNSRPSRIADVIAEYRDEMSKFPYAVGVAIGTDLQGVTSQTEGDPDVVITYPFTSYDGLVTFHRPKTGNRTFDYASEGIAHYGLLPEWVENLRQVAERRDDQIMEVFMNSAEAYLQMWGRAEAAAR